ncbi:cobalamin-dependent methionine synthase I [Spirosoma lacussanchae]|uniref:vitamin B12 dependent-methionine synthase activation domain-containing protein n=1 Tax=Spirosoma lacussanchae TaxID=1884249 RepID=UPI0011099E00|nr:vitamin B12 dependent-methionine synthase activation domain-containing protein [Spirosoma lacussanchae]
MIDWPAFSPFPSQFIGVSTFDAADTDRVRTYLNWSELLRQWEIPVSFPEALDSPDWNTTARSLLADANALLDGWIAGGLLRAEVTFGVWQARAEGDQVVVQPATGAAVRLTFPRLPLADGSSYCLADLIKPAALLTTAESDYIGGYAVRLDQRIGIAIQPWVAAEDDYRVFLANDLCALYRSAVADYLHYRLRRFIWAYCDDDDLSNTEIMEGLHQGIRVPVGNYACPGPVERSGLPELLGLANPLSAGCGFFFAHPRARPFQPQPVYNSPVVNA